MKVAIHQPQYWPWPPYVHKAMAADIFVYLDTVQFTKNGLQNRNQVKTAQGAQWLTLPVRQHLGQSILDVEIADTRATSKHWKTLEANYAHAPGFMRWRDELYELLHSETRSLCEMAIRSTEWMLLKLGAGSRRVRASEIAEREGNASQLVASICGALGASAYLTGTGALSYLERADFDRIGCEVLVQRWEEPFLYPQTFARTGFIPGLSALDLLLNCPDEAAALITGAGSWQPLQVFEA